MTAVVFIAGLMLGGMAATVILCCLQLHRVSEYQREVELLKKKINNKSN